MRVLPQHNPKVRFRASELEYLEGEAPHAEVRVLDDQSRTILASNDSPDVGFRYSVNPYRGCFHGCAYCYARPTHEYLDLGAGTDFERVLVVKREAPALLREAFAKRSWRGELVAFSGVTDCYQPLEARLELTRQCLEVCLAQQNPVTVITKSPLVERDIDLLAELGLRTSASVAVSIPFWDRDDARALEPYVATPERRMRTIERLSRAGVRVGVSISPVIPGLTDSSIAAILEAAASAGASFAFYVLLRLPGAVKEVFVERLRTAMPGRAEKVLRRMREIHGDGLYRSRFGERQRGTGTYAAMIAQLFETQAARFGLAGAMPPPREDTFRRPATSGQLALF